MRQLGKSIPNKRRDAIDARKQLHLVSQSQPPKFRAIKIPHQVEKVRTAEVRSVPAFGRADGDRIEETGTSQLALSLEMILDPLSSERTGKAAVWEMLRRVVLLRDSCRMSTNHLLPGEPCPNEVILSCESLVREQRLTLRAHVVRRLEESVFEGELPEDADVEALATLCVSSLIGPAVSARDEFPIAHLLNLVEFFVDGLGFHTVRPTRHRDRGPRARTRGG